MKPDKSVTKWSNQLAKEYNRLVTESEIGKLSDENQLRLEYLEAIRTRIFARPDRRKDNYRPDRRRKDRDYESEND